MYTLLAMMIYSHTQCVAIAEGGITPPRPFRRISFPELEPVPTQRRKKHKALHLGPCKDHETETDRGHTQRPKVQKPELASVLHLDEVC